MPPASAWARRSCSRKATRSTPARFCRPVRAWRAEAARVVERERQSLRDAVVRFNVEGLVGLRNRPRPEKLSPARQEELRAEVLAGPDPEADGMSSYRLPDLAAHAQQWWSVSYGLSSENRTPQTWPTSNRELLRF